MLPIETQRAIRRDFFIASIMVAGGLAVCGVSLMQLSAQQDVSVQRQMAQATQPVQETPAVRSGKDNAPAESMPGGTRPTTPAPEPARPDADAQKAGAVPALPPAPAEKMGEPVRN